LFHLSGASNVSSTGHFKVVLKQIDEDDNNNQYYLLIDDLYSYEIKGDSAKNYVFSDVSNPNVLQNTKSLLQKSKSSRKNEKNSKELVIINQCQDIPECVYMLFFQRVEWWDK